MQVRGAQFAFRVVELAAVAVEDLPGQRVLGPRLEPAFVRMVDEGGVADGLAPVLVVVEEVAVEALDEFAQRRGQGRFLGRALAIGEAQRRLHIAQVQRPDVGHDVAPGGDLHLHAQLGEDAGELGDGLFQRPVLAGNVGLAGAIAGQQQGLGIGVEAFHRLDDEVWTGLHRLLHRAAIDGSEDALAVLVGQVGGQLHLDLEGLLVAILRVDDVALRQADVIGGDVAGLAIELDEIGRAERRGRQEIVEGPRGRAVTLVADGLIGDHREVVELGLEPQVVEKIDLDFHAQHSGLETEWPPLSGQRAAGDTQAVVSPPADSASPAERCRPDSARRGNRRRP